MNNKKLNEIIKSDDSEMTIDQQILFLKKENKKLEKETKTILKNLGLELGFK